uniref:RxLR effector candidate protein n=1 Tax=Hyaloperonospora arabidopsidis (strain Emoy2) TaxID=559515 RepID=M4C4A8_HYAAE
MKLWWMALSLQDKIVIVVDCQEAADTAMGKGVEGQRQVGQRVYRVLAALRHPGHKTLSQNGT